MEPVAPQPQAETTKQATDTAQNSSVKVDYATDLFNMLSLDSPSEDGAEASHADDNNWAGFQFAGEASTAEQTSDTKSVESIPRQLLESRISLRTPAKAPQPSTLPRVRFM